MRVPNQTSFKRRLATAVAIGCGASATMDVVAEVIKGTTGVAPLNLDLVGRWVGHFPRGVFRHRSIAEAEPVKNERAIGWIAHYGIGITFAAALVEACPNWPKKPTLGPAMTAGLLTTAAPWLIMQPAFGIGVAAAKTPDPTTSRIRSLRAHASFGLGLYLSAKLLHWVGSRTRVEPRR